MLVDSQFSEIEKRLRTVMLRDRYRLRSELNRIRADFKAGKPVDPRLESFNQRLAEAVARFDARKSGLPDPKIDADLPIFERQAEIIEAIQKNQVVVISGETGSGKSTQLPLMALKAGYGVTGLIGHTQPRRIAARGVASRIAQQMGSALGSDVGFKIRFADKTSERTYVKLMTDGILLAETQGDRFLEQYDLIIVDEAHERSLNIDFLLGYLKRILSKRRDLRLVITSATIDTERFAAHFTEDENSPVPIIDVEGRTYPVEIQYIPLEEKLVEPAGGASQTEIEDHTAQVCRELAGIDDGDMLVFLPTENDIRTLNKKLRATRLPGRQTEILPLYARLSTDQQNQIFQPGKARRIVLATNVAESSITVPRIRYVVDTGTARISHYSPRSKVQRLPIQAVSQASANQRAGRCGRIGPGICVRLFSEEDFESRPKFTTPEIRRTNLASVILQTLALKLGQIDEFPFLDPPRPEAIRDGFKTLFELGAVDDHRRLTELGRQLARMPVDPRIGRMIFAADEENCLSEILIIASGLEMQDPRMRPVERKQAADTQHKKFVNEKSDFLSLLNIWDFYHEQKENLSNSKLKLACQTNFLSYPLMRQWQDIHRQLRSMVVDQRLKTRSRQNDYDAIHRSLLAGLLSGVALLGDRHEYTGASNIKFHLWPGSGIFESKPKWIVAAEIVETSRRYGRTVGKISPDWIEKLASHLVKRRYSEPHWSKKRQSVMASEHVTLFGLPIVSGRSVGYGKIDPQVSRDLFIERALADGEFEGNHEFYQHNLWLLEEVKSEAAKTRNRDLIVNTDSIIDFYQARIPADATDGISLAKAIKGDPELDVQLRMTRSDLLNASELADVATQFPSEVQVGSMQIPIQYKFAPGANDDGATVRLPLEGVGQLDDAQTGWLIPGLMESRIVALIRSLPKSVRRNLVPAPETARKVVQTIEFGRGIFVEAVARELTKIGGLPIEATQFKTEKLDDHLKVNLQVIDETGEVVAEGRSVAELRSQLGAEHSSNIVEVEDSTWKQNGLIAWSWAELPREIMITRGGTQLAAFPAIVDQGKAVGLRLTDSQNASDMTTRQGLVRLFQITNRKSLRSQTNWLPGLEQHAVTLSRIVSAADLKRQLSDLITRVAFVDRKKIPRDKAQFDSIQSTAVEQISIATQDLAKWLPKFANAVHQVELNLEDLPARFGTAKGDIKKQIAELKSEEFIAQTPWPWLEQYPRYFSAISFRISKLDSTPPEKDRGFADELAAYWKQYLGMKSMHESQAIVDPELVTYRWMIEELRVSVFAQKLGTCLTVSPKRMEKQWAKVRRI
ncbi:MAG: ATP-dependent helicase HrpA [Mariniblastus sp.]|jgi:ATP-dependent helicase HrpA